MSDYARRWAEADSDRTRRGREAMTVASNVSRLPRRACPACGAARAADFGAVQEISLSRCAECRTIFTRAHPVAIEAEDYDAYRGWGDLSVPDFVDRQLDELVVGFERWRSTNRWLDIGCGRGALLRAAAKAGWCVTGTDVASPPIDMLTRQGFDVKLGELRDCGLPARAFDVVTMVEVIEHVPDPRALLADAGGLLRPGGALYITTPNPCGISARLLRVRWSVVSPPEHLQLLSIAGLKILLRRASLRVESIRTDAVNPYELLAAVRRRPRQLDRVQTAYDLNAALLSSGGGRAAKRIANAALTVARLGDAIKLTATRPA